MRTILEHARRGNVTSPMHAVAEEEGIDAGVLCGRIATGSVVIMQRGRRCVGIGKGLRTKVNVNLGTSSL